MLKNYFKIAWRNLVKNRMHSFINIAGLSVGMAVAILIGLWIWDEVSYNKNFDKLFLRLRNQFGGECIPMRETLRRIITLKREHQKTFVGFIADQSPKWNSIHHWVPFLHRETPIFIGTEQIAKQVGAVVYFTDVKRIKRGYYHCELKRMTVHPQELPDYQLTDMYARMLEEMIQREPAYWLWSHNRWKRTKEEWERRQSQV